MVIETALPTASYASFALTPDSSSFATDSPENKGLLDKGFGFPVQVRRVLDRHVLVASIAAKVLVPVPFGWRGFDDGKRTRLFTPIGSIGLVVNVVSIEQFANWDDAREQLWRAARTQIDPRAKQDPRYQARFIKLGDGSFGIRETNIQDPDGPYSSVIMFRRHPTDAKLAVRVNLFTPVDEFERHLGLVSLVLRDIQVPQ